MDPIPLEPVEDEPSRPRPVRPPAPPPADLVVGDRPCTACGYNLRGLPRVGRCPECGAMIEGRGATTEPTPEQRARECAGCGYNLRGLPPGGRCPECGLPATLTSRRKIDDPLSVMPIAVIRTIRRGCWFAAAVLVGLIAAIALWAFGAYPPLTAASMLVAMSALWVAAAWFVTPVFHLPQAVFYGFTERNRTLRMARWLQFGWVGAALLVLLHSNAATRAAFPGWMFATGQLVCLAVGFVGLVALSLLLQELARWVRDDTAERALNFPVWGIPTAFLLTIANVPILIVSVLVLLLWVVSLGALPYGLLSLARSVTLATVHSREHQDRLRRKFERDRSHESRLGRTIDEMDRAREKFGHNI